MSAFDNYSVTDTANNYSKTTIFLDFDKLLSDKIYKIVLDTNKHVDEQVNSNSK